MCGSDIHNLIMFAEESSNSCCSFLQTDKIIINSWGQKGEERGEVDRAWSGRGGRIDSRGRQGGGGGVTVEGEVVDTRGNGGGRGVQRLVGERWGR